MKLARMISIPDSSSAALLNDLVNCFASLISIRSFGGMRIEKSPFASSPMCQVMLRIGFTMVRSMATEIMMASRSDSRAIMLMLERGEHKERLAAYGT